MTAALRVTVVHGYYLHDSGSGVYVRELTRELVRQGHDVTLVCQERSPELYDFIDSAYALDSANAELVPLFETRTPRYSGRCRLVRPHLGGRLLVFVEGPFPGFASSGIKAFHHAPADWIQEYVAANVRALRSAFAAWPPDVVQANHAIMQPYAVRAALAGAAPYLATVHGSELNFSLKPDRRLAPYALDGLRDAAAVVSVSPAMVADAVAWAASEGLDIASKSSVLPPGVDTALMTPAPDRQAALESLARDVALPPELDLAPEDDVLAFAGRLMWTKGIQHVVAALPLMAARRPRLRLLIAGDGPAREPARKLLRLLGDDDRPGATALAQTEPELRTLPEYGPVVPSAIAPPLPEGRLQAAFLGHLTSTQLARVFAAADLSLAPSVFPEAVGMVTVEALVGRGPAGGRVPQRVGVGGGRGGALARGPGLPGADPRSVPHPGDGPPGPRPLAALPHGRPGLPHASPRPGRSALPLLGEGGPPLPGAGRPVGYPGSPRAPVRAARARAEAARAAGRVPPRTRPPARRREAAPATARPAGPSRTCPPSSLRTCCRWSSPPTGRPPAGRPRPAGARSPPL